MKGYQEASEQIKEIERTLSTNPKASIDTALRKITSALRDNVNTNYGKRKELVGFLARSGATHLPQKIAGEALKSYVPRGLAMGAAVSSAAQDRRNDRSEQNANSANVNARGLQRSNSERRDNAFRKIATANACATRI
jgi:uncharacterized protein YoaH (UPF0181 family)